MLTELEIQTRILQSDILIERIEKFIAELDRQGVLGLFINQEAFSAFTQMVAEEDILHDQFKVLESIGSSVLKNYVIYYIRNIAKTLAINEYNDEYDFTEWGSRIISMDSDPEYIFDLYFSLMEYAVEISEMFGKAVEFHFRVMEYEYNEGGLKARAKNTLWKKILSQKVKLQGLMMDAFPSGIEYHATSSKWIKTHKEEFDEVNPYLNLVVEAIPYDVIQRHFTQTEIVPTKKSAEEIKAREIELFKCILLDDVFEVINENGFDTRPEVISEMVTKLYLDSPIYVHMRFIQACYMFYREEYFCREEEKIEYMFSTMPELFKQGMVGSINIPS